MRSCAPKGKRHADLFERRECQTTALPREKANNAAVMTSQLHSISYALHERLRTELEQLSGIADHSHGFSKRDRSFIGRPNIGLLNVHFSLRTCLCQ